VLHPRFVKAFGGREYVAELNEDALLVLIEGSNDWDGWFVERTTVKDKSLWVLTGPDGELAHIPGIERDESYEEEA